MTSDLIRTNQVCIVKIHLCKTEYAEGDTWEESQQDINRDRGRLGFPRMDATTFLSHVLLKGWPHLYEEVESEALPWTCRTVGVALTNRGSQSGAAWSPRLLENPVRIPVALPQECTLGPELAWKKSHHSEVVLLERPESQREMLRVDQAFQPARLWVSLPGTCYAREWNSCWSQPQLWWQKCHCISQLWVKIAWLLSVNS